MLRSAARNPKYRHLLKRWCQKDILFWINAFVWTLDTRETKSGTLAPFITFQCQDEAILKLRKALLPTGESIQHDAVIEKSRDMGATWICTLVFLHALLFEPQPIDLFCMSYKEEVVDGGPATIMGKARMCLEHLPSWLRPKMQMNQMFFKNLETGSTWHGSSTTSNAGVSGRYAGMFLDEFSLVEQAEDVWHRTAACSNCRIVNSTHRGSAHPFAQIVRLSQEVALETPVTTRAVCERIGLHWTKHPWKTEGLYRDDYGKTRSPWYDDECRRLGYNKQAIAQELDMDPQASGWQFFDPLEIRDLISKYARSPLREGTMSGGFRQQSGGHLKLWFRDDPPRARYAIGNDVASGSGGKFGTPSCSSVVNLETGEKVAELSDANLRPDRFARIVWELARWFHGAMVNFENTGSVGSMFRRALIEDYRYTHFRLNRDKEDTFSPDITNRIGWIPTAENKGELLHSYREALVSGMFLNRSKGALEETLQFQYVDGKIVHTLEKVKGDHAAVGTLHGDMVIADALAWLMVREAGVVKAKLVVHEEKGPPPYGSIAWREMMEDKEDDWDGW